jgi:predicted enzyme involved in methoxymalonyl-ACP biosynthesis
VGLTQEDLARAEAYQANAARSTAAAKFATYDEYLQWLQMTAEIDGFQGVYYDRITQLINKTNQFNLTTRRYTSTEVTRAAEDPSHVTLYGRLTDKFGDNGLVSVVIGRLEDRDLHVDLWLMSCRVLKRDMEVAMLDTLVGRAAARGASRIIGYYLRSAKNKMVEDHYPKLGFALRSSAPDGSESVWTLDVSSYTPRNRHIQIKVASSNTHGQRIHHPRVGPDLPGRSGSTPAAPESGEQRFQRGRLGLSGPRQSGDGDRAADGHTFRVGRAAGPKERR